MDVAVGFRRRAFVVVEDVMCGVRDRWRQVGCTA
jgi:hypothetical protein